ncbi:MAG: sigma-70 family RNA polymerase sigma factor [Gemmatimonadaceae bacterium]|nr:sigma-70 family RNA polymerase sigma factor [Gemmatimonadaceae bacterium]NUQ92297.1 sigma-70 family RNA polymerase sigma factor [Gemmatimonadaceae bacterium]NUR19728.1 sigma-70 family RNA polymerase sigma factor [Gemmatimonadaceae bacterium]
MTARPVPLPMVELDEVPPTVERAGDTPVAVEPAVDDRAWVRAARDGDATAFGMLVRLHQRRAYGIARAIVLSHEDAEDAVQEGFLHAYRAMARFDAAYPFGAWLARIVANAALDLVRRRKVRATQEIPATIALPFSDPAERSELRRRLREALAALPPRQRAVLMLHDVEGYRHAEIGAMLGMPEGTARSDLHHARATMRRALDDLRSTR